MLKGQLPQYFDPKRYAEQTLEIEGETSVGKLPRIRDYQSGHNEDSVPVAVKLYFSKDEEGLHVVQGTVDARLDLTCQRCLEPTRADVHAEVAVALVWSEEQARHLPDHYDPWLVTSDKMPLSELLEEELLLALPIVATHDECEPAEVPGVNQVPDPDQADSKQSGEQRKDNPFAVLASLKKDGQNSKT